MKNHGLAVAAAIVIALGLAFIASNLLYIYKHPLVTTPKSVANSAITPASTEQAPTILSDAQEAAVYNDLENRLNDIRAEQNAQ